MVKAKWGGVTLPKNLIVKTYDKVSTFKFSSDFGILSGYVFSHPNNLIKNGVEDTVSVIFQMNRTFTLARGADKKVLSAADFTQTVNNPQKAAAETVETPDEATRLVLNDVFDEDIAEDGEGRQVLYGENTKKYVVAENVCLTLDGDYLIRFTEEDKKSLLGRVSGGEKVIFDTVDEAKAALLDTAPAFDYEKGWAKYKNYVNDKAYETNTPKALLSRKIFVCWKFVYYAEDGSPLKKPAKIPYNPKSGGRAMANTPSSWGSFEEACAAVDKFGFDGIGIETGKSVVGIDVDNCIEDGKFNSVATEILTAVPSYAEYSPSTVFDADGNAVSGGLRILVFGRLTANVLNKECEFWVSDHYVTLTGHAIKNAPTYMPKLVDVAAGLDLVYKKYGAKHRNPKKADYDGLTFDKKFTSSEIVEIIKKSDKMGAKFKRLCNGLPPQLYDDGSASYTNDTDGYYLKADGTPDLSKIDGAFCRILVFMCATPTQIDEIYRAQRKNSLSPELTLGTGLARPKWDRGLGDTTYGGYQIRRAFEAITNRYSPSK